MMNIKNIRIEVILIHCYRLHVCSSPNFISLSPNLHCDDNKGGGLWAVIRSL